MRVNIRPLDVPDRGALLDLRHALWPHHIKNDLDAELSLLFADPRYVFFGAFSEAALVGYTEAAERDRGDGCETQPVGWVEGIYVLPDYRRRGIAQSLVGTVADWARGRELTELGSDVHLDNLSSLEAHAAWGFEETKRVVMLRRKLA